MQFFPCCVIFIHSFLPHPLSLSCVIHSMTNVLIFLSGGMTSGVKGRHLLLAYTIAHCLGNGERRQGMKGSEVIRMTSHSLPSISLYSTPTTPLFFITSNYSLFFLFPPLLYSLFSSPFQFLASSSYSSHLSLSSHTFPSLSSRLSLPSITSVILSSFPLPTLPPSPIFQPLLPLHCLLITSLQSSTSPTSVLRLPAPFLISLPFLSFNSSSLTLPPPPPQHSFLHPILSHPSVPLPSRSNVLYWQERGKPDRPTS